MKSDFFFFELERVIKEEEGEGERFREGERECVRKRDGDRKSEKVRERQREARERTDKLKAAMIYVQNFK